MKTLKQTCVILFSLITLAACNQRPEDSETVLVYSSSSSISLTSSEKAQAAEEQLINRLQAIISEYDGVSDTVIAITTSEETEKEMVVSITTEENKPLTDKQKEGIIHIIAASCDDIDADNIHITES